MVFSSTTFLFLFLPLVLTAYFLVPRRYRNGILLAASLFFYAWGEVFYVALMIASIVVNFVLGLSVGSAAEGRRRTAVVAALVFNLGLLVAFKYANFLVDNWNVLGGRLGLPEVELGRVHLPIGISFFTFQALSYVIDVYRGQARVQRKLVDLGLFIALFPQLIAGPIVRYEAIAEQLRQRRERIATFALGVERFVIGLGKKVLIANAVSVPADQVFGMPAGELTAATAWLGALCYSLQIYFDFSGYSDMAIGLGHMFGFQLPENFLHPYGSRSIREFWRRWHVSLSTWFRDYVYIPLGGNRGGSVRTSVNLVAIFFLCGLWHGASWTFVVWGLYHGFFLSLERLRPLAPLGRVPTPVKVLYTVLVWMVGWVFFRATSLSQAAEMIRALAFLGGVPGLGLEQARGFVDAQLSVVIPLGIVGSVAWYRPAFAWFRGVRSRLRGGLARATDGLSDVVVVGFLLAVFVLCAIDLSASTHNPFIYFQF